MNISFTICSANYLPFAKSAADSLIRHNAQHEFIIILLDKRPEKNPGFFGPHRIITAEEMELQDFEEMNERYDIFELSCAMKAFAADYIFRTCTKCDRLFYFDSDIFVYGKLTEAETMLEKNPILLTPHLATTKLFINRDKAEKDNLRTGIYNAGFFGLRRHEESCRFLSWWMDRVRIYCYNDAAHGLFVDQLWLNLVPVIFRNAAILYNEGYNVAYWNLGERYLSFAGEGYIINDKYPLVFFHFSGYDIESENVLSKHLLLYTFDNRPECLTLFNDYSRVVKQNNQDDYFSVVPQFGKKAAPVAELPEPPPPPPPPAKSFFLKLIHKNGFRKKNGETNT